MSDTRTRVPRMCGRPPQISGSTRMRSWDARLTALLPPTRTSLRTQIRAPTCVRSCPWVLEEPPQGAREFDPEGRIGRHGIEPFPENCLAPSSVPAGGARQVGSRCAFRVPDKLRRSEHPRPVVRPDRVPRPRQPHPPGESGLLPYFGLVPGDVLHHLVHAIDKRIRHDRLPSCDTPTMTVAGYQPRPVDSAPGSRIANARTRPSPGATSSFSGRLRRSQRHYRPH